MRGHPLSTHIADVLALDPSARAIEYDGAWCSWGEVNALARRIASFAPAGRRVGMLLRNRPAHVAGLLGVLVGGGTAVVINPTRGDDRVRADIDALRLPLIIGRHADLARLVSTTDTTTVALDGFTTPITAADLPGAADGPADIAVRMLTSGTTGPPKRIDLTYDMLAYSVVGPAFETASPPRTLRRGVAIVNAPLVHIGGVFRVLQSVCAGRSFALLDRFELDRWADAVRRHKPAAVSLVPAALRAVLHSDLTRDDLAGVRAVTCGTAPLSADDADAFTGKFGIPVLTSYAATEFGGGVAGWTLADYRDHWHDKRGSVGRASPGAHLRVVDDDGDPLKPGEVGLLEVRPGQLGADAEWMRTTDLARIDTDGFIWIVGRADQAIIRGGFKVMPDDVRAALESHPAVRDAAVVGSRDARLGEVPVAMVEPRRPVESPQLIDYLRSRLAPYEIPTHIAIVDHLPRTPSGKPDLAAVRRFFTGDHG
ncbi:class I adenylate-forming enzyme family protein [Mycobacterium sp. IDR2000157661]|uniref:class I adenylate-forming enzyme family protein n=1 Tax=Mycobacterium sp. IDR2000157661 TaxID=2867005 RepID=UPI001EEA11C2|nr:AMP-binding protein [Mycobacterium sp. IDR2000157661]ULE33303.1 AMP-binding protein [Mycobacterium sp. IDR2000157661]